MAKHEHGQGWLEQPHIVNRLVYGLWTACALILLVDLLYTKHPHFGFEGWFGFYAFFGFLAYCLIVLSAKGLRRLVKRDEDYYGDGADLAAGEDEHHEP